MSTDTIAPIPTSGYVAWFVAADGEPFGLPVAYLVPNVVCYGPNEVGDDIVDTEWQPAVLTAGGSLLELADADALPALFGGVLVGVAPAELDQAAALAWLETTKVFPADDQGRLGAHIDPEMVGRVTAARRQLPGRLSSAR